jgi:CheY-like chemotaxis protein
MGGSIGFQSAVGLGTTFFMELPRAPDTPSGLSDTSRWRVLVCQEELTSKPRVLHVEDDLDLCRVLRTALEDQVEIVTATTLEEALGRLQSEPFSLVLLDVKLPDGNGLSLMERLPPAGEKTMPPVVILSATEVAQEVQRRVAAALVKSRVSESAIVKTILSIVRPPAARLVIHPGQS